MKNIVFLSAFVSGIAVIILYLLGNLRSWHDLEIQISKGNRPGTLGLTAKSTVWGLGPPHGFCICVQTS